MIIGKDIFNGSTVDYRCKKSDNILVTDIKQTEWTVVSIDDQGYVTLMDLKGNIRQDLKLPDENEEDKIKANKIKELLEEGKEFSVSVLECMKIEKIIEVNEK